MALYKPAFRLYGIGFTRVARAASIQAHVHHPIQYPSIPRIAARSDRRHNRYFGCVCCRVFDLGIDLPGNPRRCRIVSSPSFGGVAPLGLRLDVLSHVAMANGNSSDPGALAHGGLYRVPVAVRGERRGLHRGTNRAVGSNRTIGGHGFAVDGSGGLAAAWRYTPRS